MERDWYKIHAAAEEAEVYIYEDIGADFFAEGVSASDESSPAWPYQST